MNLKIFGTALLLQLLFTLQTPTVADSGQPEESQLKAVFVLNFAKLTEWPADNLADGSTFTIAILGKVPSVAFFNLLKGQTVRGAKVSVRRIEEVGEAKGSHLLYISESERYRLTGILRELNQQDILTVSDISGFCEAGGMIGLMPVQNRLGFEVNLASVRKTRLTVGSQLLKLARTIFGN
ncbi:MAG: YfiR family protein [Desulfuromonadaceae bacterium]|nr:YfiR family protein [Desulfuromonadaceae bacterium]